MFHLNPIVQKQSEEFKSREMQQNNFKKMSCTPKKNGSFMKYLEQEKPGEIWIKEANGT